MREAGEEYQRLVCRSQTRCSTTSTDFNDHRDVDGFKYPFQVKTMNPQQTVSITVTKVVHNTTLDPSIFSIPSN